MYMLEILQTSFVFVSLKLMVSMMSFCALFLLVVAANVAPMPESVESPEVRLSILASLHYDKFSGRPGGYGVCNQGQDKLATPGCDSSLGLIRSVLEDVSKFHGSITLVTGGLIRHGTSSISVGEIDSMSQDIVTLLAEVNNISKARSGNDLQMMQVALGGTDFIPQDQFTPEKHLKSNILVDLMELEGLLTSEEKAKVSTCGFFYRDLSHVKLRIVSLNTLLWSKSLKPQLGVGDVDPCGQFPFLQDALEGAKQRGHSVIIIGDVPPIINVEDAMHKGSVESAEYYWRDDFRETYVRVIATYHFTVVAQFFGNSSTFGFVTSSEVGPPMYIVPPVSPVTGSNPSYIRVTLDGSTSRVVSLTQRYLTDNGVWAGGESLKDAIATRLENMSGNLLEHFLLLMERENKWERFAVMRVGGRFLTQRKPCGMHCRRMIICSSLYYLKGSIENCTSTRLPSWNTGVIIGIFFTVFGVLSIILSFLYIVVHHNVIFDPPAALVLGKGRRLMEI